MAELKDLSLFTRERSDGLSEMELAVEGVRCGGCITRIESSLKKMKGIVDARVNFSNRRLTVAWQRGRIEPGAVVNALQRMGYPTHPFRADDNEKKQLDESRWLMRCLAVAGFAAMNIMLLSVSVWSGNVTDITSETRDLFHWASALIALPAAAYAGQPFFRSAWTALRARSVNMDVPISLGVLLALGMSLVETINHATHAYFDSAVMLLFFLLCGRYLDHALRRRTRLVAGNLAALRADVAHRLEANGEIIQMPPAALKAGDRILVRAGERIPADGIIVNGRSEIDEGMVTGETVPRSVQSGAQVFAGSMNRLGALTIRITAAGENTLLDEIERLLDRAVKSKSRYVRIADRAARHYAPVVHATAALTLAGWLIAGASIHDALLTAIAVLIITCPCALALAIPVVQVVTAGRLFRGGILLNTGDAIERLAEVDTIVFDKTGTLTLPEPGIANAADIDPQLLASAARLALSSRHPLAGALAPYAGQAAPFEEVIEEAGQGVRTVVDGVEMRLGSAAFCDVRADEIRAATEGHAGSTIVFRHGDQIAAFAIEQSVRSDAAAAIAALRAMNLDLRILSGDRADAVAPVARNLQIENWKGGLKPADKVAALDALRAEGRRVLMVGDGINDAPSLAAAYVSMSPITAADLSQAQADAVFTGEKLAPIAEAVLTARRARVLMRQNLWLAVIYNLVAVPIAIAGLVTPLIAAAAMSGSSILVTLNALRLHGDGRMLSLLRDLASRENKNPSARPI